MVANTPKYKLTTGVVAGIGADYIRTVTVVTTNVIDKFGMVVDREGLHAIRAEVERMQQGTNSPHTIVFVREGSI